MKLRATFFLVYFLFTFFTRSQTINLSDASEVDDAVIAYSESSAHAHYQSTNFGTSGYLRASAWTTSGQMTNFRSFIKFDLSQIPTGTRITNATLTLKTDLSWTGDSQTNTSLTASNEAYLERVIGSWSETGLTWNNQPTVTTDDRIYLPESTDSYETRIVDLTQMVQYWLDNPSQNHGMRMKLVNEVYYTSRNYGSSENTSYAPMLSITYDAPPPSSFITTWKTTNQGSSRFNQIRIPTTGQGYHYTVSWEQIGDVSNTGTAGPFTGTSVINLRSPGTYKVTISGDFPRIYFNNGGDKEKLLSVDQWGDNVWTSFEGAFYGCTNLRINATDAPNLSETEDMSQMFRGNKVLNDSMDHWKVDHVLRLTSMFQGATAFNQPLDSWNTAKAINMSQMFMDAISFDQPLGDWDIVNVSDINNMLSNTALSIQTMKQPLMGGSRLLWYPLG